MDLKELGWKEIFEKHFDEIKTEGVFPARVVVAQKQFYGLLGTQGELQAAISGKLRFRAEETGEVPAVGDWVVARKGPGGDSIVIEDILPRFSRFSRKVAGQKTDEQVLVANIDILFIVNGLDGDYSLRRIERYLALAWNSGVRPVIILNKTDVCDKVEERVAEVEAVAFGAPVITLSAATDTAVQEIRKYIEKGITIAFLGSSGVGKSTIINCLLGEERQKVGAVRESDSTGRHVTTCRELIILQGGGIVIDNPGMRELQLWMDEEGLDRAFGDIMELASDCKFRDCAHENEPGCAVKAALENGGLEPDRFQSYVKLKKELKYLATRKLGKAYNEGEKFRKQIGKWRKQIKNHKKKNQ